MSNTVIKVENLSKQYRLGEVGTGTISHDLNRWWAKVRGKEDPFLKIGETNDRTSKGSSDYVWAIKDINFDIQQGDAVGIIGRNGAGKSTLLKILSKTTTPTTGSIKIKGRIASLLEVGTGFHPEMTGRENIFLNGAILGMRKKEIARKFDEIVDFAGVERYIDTPVKRYSSGMYVRLAFAVAAHLESEILIVDEVLAVGDAEFQKKCLGKMGEVSKGEGRTVLFVSHNMAAVKSLCNRAVLLENGLAIENGSVDVVLSRYLKGNSIIQNKRVFGENFRKEEFSLHEISIYAKEKGEGELVDEYDEICLRTEVTLNKNKDIKITYVVKNENGDDLFTFSHQPNVKLDVGFNSLLCTFPKGFLNIGSYFLTLYVIENSLNSIFIEKDIFVFNVAEGKREIGKWLGREPGFIKPKFNWKKLL